MSSKLNLDPGVVSACRQAAKRIAEDVFEQISARTTVSVERSVTRLLGVDGADELEVPLPNVLVEHVAARGGLERGIAFWLGNAMLATQRTPQQIAEAVSAGELDLIGLEPAEEPAIRERVQRGVQRPHRRDRGPLRGPPGDAPAPRRSARAAALRADRDG